MCQDNINHFGQDKLYHIIYNYIGGDADMIIRYLDEEIGGLILNHKEINKTKLALKYGVDRHTIDRHIKKYEHPKVRKKRECGLLKYYETISNMLKVDSSIKSTYMSLLNLSSIEEIGSYSNYKQYVEKHFTEVRKESKEKIAKYRYETIPGEQLQFDWIEGIKLHLKNGVLIEFNLWSATLGYSRRHIFKFTYTITEADFRKCLIDTFITIGGTTKHALTDNMSAIVNVNKGKKTIHPTVIQFMKDMGMELRLCKCRHPFTKGKVEVSNKYQQWLNPYDYKFDTTEDLEKGVEEILSQCNYQANSETKVAPIVLYDLEKKYLSPLPNIALLKKYHSEFIELKVGNSCLVYYNGAKYGVSDEYINSTVLLSESNASIHLYNKNLIKIATYPKYNKGIHYANGLYSVCSRNGESKQEFEERIAKNLALLAKVGSYNFVGANNG